ncbi:hypothetical protein LSI54_01825 [Nesterenkonia sp. AY15]|uniref:hypothetical protein n=1 Tax=Nesterenkonia sp. AY15 TaxID=2901139 RepID=UPI001F4CBB9C|nr:hypothetical protein [Nesterenkonia sp. AY15]MCH8570108.1 hypothetical protein [Nesterenkonia sp. AY15]
MRWDALFEDLETQLGAAQTAELTAASAEASRLEASRLEFAERLRAHRERELGLQIAGGQRLVVRVGAVGADWLAGAVLPHSVLVPLTSILAVDGMARAAARSEPSASRRRLSITAPLRRLARDRELVSVFGTQGLLASGLIAAAGRDFVEIAPTRRDDLLPRGSQGGGARSALVIPLHAVAWLRSESADVEQLSPRSGLS